MKKSIFIADLLANRLDNSFNLFGFHFGLSVIIDLIPGLGDTIDLLLSCYLVWLALQMRVPTIKVIQMLWNISFSFLIGLIPVIGDAAYIFYKPNLRNLAILKQYDKTIIEGEIIT